MCCGTIHAYRRMDKTREVEMIVAVPCYKGRISPLFDTCRQVMIAETNDEEGIREIGRIHFSTDYPIEKIRAMEQNHIDLLICGAISDSLYELIGLRGTRVIPWTAGAVNDVLTAYCNNALNRPSFHVPGRCRRGRGVHGRRPCRNDYKGGRR